MVDYHRQGCVHGRVTSKFWEISDNISETVQDKQLQWKTIGKSYVAYRMAPFQTRLKATFAV